MKLSRRSFAGLGCPAAVLSTALLGLGSILFPASAADPDLIGHWKGALEMGKFRMQFDLTIARTEDHRVQATIDIPDQGARGLPVAAVLFNAPDVRLEIDQFGTAFVGQLTPDGQVIQGRFEDGPGGKPVEVKFTRNAAGDAPPPVKSYAVGAGESPDLRGYWLATLEAPPDLRVRTALKIGRFPDGRFEAVLDRFEQGMHDVPATSVTAEAGVVKLAWDFMHATFEGKLEEAATKLTGIWRDGPKDRAVSFARLERPATGFPQDTSFEPDPKTAGDLRGTWEGQLDVEGRRIRVIMKLGKTPQGLFAASLASPDQGGGEIASTSVTQDAGLTRLEWKAIRAKFEGTASADGTELSGPWDQGGRTLPLRLRRVAGADKTPKQP